MIRFSVIIPTLNRPDRLAACLQSFFELEYPDTDWELILVNDGGEHSFSAITADMFNQLPLTLIDIEHGGPAKARNAGEKIARGEFVVFTDDDCRVDKNWLRAFEKGFADSTFEALGGKILNPYPDNIPAETWSRYMDYLRNELMRDKDNNLLLLISNNAAYRRTIFEKLGGFDETFPYAAAEDSELGIRLAGAGYHQVYWPDAIIWHDHKNTYGGYLRQQFRYGQGNYYFQMILENKDDFHAIERQKYSFWSSMLKLMTFAEKMESPLNMKLLLLATPFAFKAGTMWETLRIQLQRSAAAPSATLDE